MMLTQERLKELLHYDPDTGIFRYKMSRGRVKKGASAGYIQHCWHLVIAVEGKTYTAGKLAFLYMKGYLQENL